MQLYFRYKEYSLYIIHVCLYFYTSYIGYAIFNRL